jgi:hypothetical protein
MKVISQYTYRPGQAVAFLIDGAIRFGNVATVITKQDKDGERTAVQVNVRHVVPGEVETEGEPERFLIPRGELICDARNSWGYGATSALVNESSEYKEAIKFEDALNAPKEDAIPPPTAAEPAPAEPAEAAQVDAAAAPVEKDGDVPL